MLQGVDVSSHNEEFSTDGRDFVIIKATEGTSYTSPVQSDQASQARDAGCVVGFYHFLWPGNIGEQAEYFVENAVSQKGDLLALDWETTTDSTAASNDEKDAFLRRVAELSPDHRVLLYCNRDFWLNRDTSSEVGDGLWIADYGSPEGKPDIEHTWLIHQYTEEPLCKDVADFASKESLQEWAANS